MGRFTDQFFERLQSEPGPVGPAGVDVLPEETSFTGALKAGYEVTSPALHLPFMWMDTQLPRDVSAEYSIPEAPPGILPSEELGGPPMTPRDVLKTLGRAMGEVGFGGYLTESPGEEYTLTPEIGEELLPLAVEFMAATPQIKAMNAAISSMLRGTERLIQIAGAPSARAHIRRMTMTGAEELAFIAEMERDVQRSSELAMEHAWMERMAPSPGAHPGAQPGVGLPIGRSTLDALEKMEGYAAPRPRRLVPGTPAGPEFEETVETRRMIEGRPPFVAGRPDPYAYMEPSARQRLGEAVVQRRELQRIMGERVDVRNEMLKRIEETGVDLLDPFDETVRVTPEKFQRAVDQVYDTHKAELPPKLHTKIWEREVPKLTGDPRYEANVIKNSQARLAEVLGRGVTPEDIANAVTDPLAKEKVVSAMVQRILNSGWYKKQAQGNIELAFLMKLGQTSIGAAVGGAYDEDDRLRGVILGALGAVALGSVLGITTRQLRRYWHVAPRAFAEAIRREGFSLKNYGKSIGTRRDLNVRGISLTPSPELVQQYMKTPEELPIAARATALRLGEREVLEVQPTVRRTLRPAEARFSLVEEIESGRILGPEDEFGGLGSYFEETGRPDLSRALIDFEEGRVPDVEWAGDVTPSLAVEKAMGGLPSPYTPEKGAEALKSAGFDSIEYGNELLVLDPKSIRVTGSKDKGLWKGKRFWAGLIDTRDGMIEEVVSFAEAEAQDFHHSLYFKPGNVSKMEEGELSFFFIDDMGRVETHGVVDPIAHDLMPAVTPDRRWVESKVRNQIKIAKPSPIEHMLSERGAIVTDEPGWVTAAKERILGSAEARGPSIESPLAEGLTKEAGFKPGETAARGSRGLAMRGLWRLTDTMKLSKDQVRALSQEVLGKTLAEATEHEIGMLKMHLVNEEALRDLIPVAELRKIAYDQLVLDSAALMHGKRAEKAINKAMKKVVGESKVLKDLSEEEAHKVINQMAKVFGTRRWMSTLNRNIVAVEDAISRMGKTGKDITRLISKNRVEEEVQAAKWIAPMVRRIEGFSDEELQSLVDVLHRGGNPINERVAQAAIAERATLNEVGAMREAISDPVLLRSGETRPFQMMENYYPILVPKEDMNALRAAMRADELAAASAGKRYFARRNIRDVFGSLDYAREAGYEPEVFDPIRDLTRYYYGSAKRITRHRNFGSRQEKVYKMLQQMRSEVSTDEHTYALKSIDRYFMHDAVDDAMSDFMKRLRSFETVTHMGLAAISNASQPVYTAVFTGFRAFAKGLLDMTRGMARADSEELVARTAAAIGGTIQDLVGEAGGAGSLTNRFLRVSGFTPIERWNRRLAAQVGMHYVRDTYRKLARSPNSGRLRRMLEEVGIDADGVLRAGLTSDDVVKGAVGVANRTQLRAGVMDLPYFMSSPYGRLWMMFKTFSYGAARLMVRDMFRDPRRLARALVAFPLAGELVADLRSLATGKGLREREGLTWLLDNYAYVGTLGIAHDFLRSVQYGEKGVMSFMSGPIIGDLAAIADATGKMIQGKPLKMGREVARRLPPPATLLRGIIPKESPQGTWTLP